MAVPADSNRLKLLQSVQTALRLILGNGTGYFNTVKSASVTLDPTASITNLATTEMPFFIVEPTASGSKFYMPFYQMKHTFQVLITGRVDVEGTSASRKTDAWEHLIADIERALTRDITREGLAIDTRLLEPQPACDIGNGSMVLVQQPIVIPHIRTYGTP